MSATTTSRAEFIERAESLVDLDPTVESGIRRTIQLAHGATLTDRCWGYLVRDLIKFEEFHTVGLHAAAGSILRQVRAMLCEGVDRG